MSSKTQNKSNEARYKVITKRYTDRSVAPRRAGGRGASGQRPKAVPEPREAGAGAGPGWGSRHQPIRSGRDRAGGRSLGPASPSTAPRRPSAVSSTPCTPGGGVRVGKFGGSGLFPHPMVKGRLIGAVVSWPWTTLGSQGLRQAGSQITGGRPGTAGTGTDAPLSSATRKDAVLPLPPPEPQEVQA